ncbi:MAG: hypothetical protein FJ011_00460 [Chloroflexi bacterium]|nr:hypothetical protein [Chloroflexota bacterium]
MYQTDLYEAMLAETVTIPGAGGELINAYFARPLGPGARVAVELSTESAKALAATIHAVLARAEAGGFSDRPA